MTAAIETLRLQYQPSRILTLFVGESPPAGGTFFYLGNSHLHRCMHKAFIQLQMVEDTACFLTWFRDQGWYLDDLVSTPVNRCGKSERRRAHRDSVASLAARIAAYRPSAVVVTPLMIRESVCQALVSSGIRVPLYAVPFPAMSHEPRFLQEMKAIGPHLPRKSR